MAQALIVIDANNDRLVSSPSLGARIYNNIFYTKYQVPNIKIESGCLSDFESDYNVFYCETGTPVFDISGGLITFSEWQAMGYDKHSVIVNPGFANTNTLVPVSRLDYGTDLGEVWKTGLSTGAKWGTANPETTAQNGNWQAGASVYAAGNSNQKVTLYPNPAIDHVYISISEVNGMIDFIRIINLSSMLVYQDKLDPNTSEYHISLNLLPGLYFVQMGFNNRPDYTEKLIVTK